MFGMAREEGDRIEALPRDLRRRVSSAVALRGRTKDAR
jgi:hypothetical protein